MNQTFYIFRHGKAIKDGKEYGDAVLSAPLLPESIPVVQRIARFLKDIANTKNFSSEILRCRQTAEIITSITKKQFVFDPLLNEFYQEDFTSFSERAALFLEKNCFGQNGPFVICTHAAVIAALKHYILYGLFHIQHQLDYIQPGEMLIIKDDKSFEILNFNQV